MTSRLLLVTKRYPANEKDTTLTWAIANIVDGMRALGVETVVVVPQKDRKWGMHVGTVRGQRVVYIPNISYLVLYRGTYESRWLHCFRLLQTLTKPRTLFQMGIGFLRKRRLAKLLSSFHSFDAVVIHGYPENAINIISPFWKGPVSLCFHDTDFGLRETPRFLHHFRDRIQNIGFRSATLRDRFIDRGWIAAGTYPIVLSGVASDTVLPRHAYRQKAPQDPLRIVIVGSLIPRKNIDHVIRVLGQWEQSNWELHVYGRGPEEMNLKTLANTLGISSKVKFHGFVAHAQLMTLYREYDVFVLLSHPETFGLVYTEALSQGLFVIGSTGEGIDGVIQSGSNGFLVGPYDEQGLLETLNEINAMPPEAARAFKDRVYESMLLLTHERICSDYRRQIAGFE